MPLLCPTTAEPVSVAALIGVFRAVLAPFGLIFAVLGSIFFGIATPTEAAGVGAFGAMLLALFKRQLESKRAQGCVATNDDNNGVYFRHLRRCKRLTHWCSAGLAATS